jgi:hypothetical protein
MLGFAENGVGFRCRSWNIFCARAPVGRDRARCLTARFPIPPVRTVRATFMAYRLTKEGQLYVQFSFSPAPWNILPWSAYAFAGYLGTSCTTFFLGSFAMCVVFLHSDYYDPSDCLEGLGDFVMALASLLSTPLNIPYRLSRVQHMRLKRDDLGGASPTIPCPRFVDSQRMYRVSQGLPVPLDTLHYQINVLTLSSTRTELSSVCWLTYQARYVRVRIPRRISHLRWIHHVIS